MLLKKLRKLPPPLLIAMGLWAAPLAASAQFGTKELSTIVPSAAFAPAGSGLIYSNVGFTYFANENNASALFLADTKLPAGAKVNSVCVFAHDSDATAEVTVDLSVIELGDTGHAPTFTQIASAGSGVAATPGYKLVCATMPANTTIRAFADADGDSSFGWLAYRIGVALPGNSKGTFAGALIKWQRQQAPAPLATTFGDVPTGFLFFRAIENLAAAGITGGCGNGQFCPNDPITRGEAAAFFAKALGLSFTE